jgi:hypothetical protein
LLATLAFAGCPGSDGNGDDPTLPGCGSDADCKGDRICVDGNCVYPGAAGGEGGSAGSAGEGGGSGGAGGSSAGAGGSGGVTDAELEAACIADCDAVSEAGCKQTNITHDQCVASCLVLDSSLQGYCFEESRDYYACKAARGYECLNDRPIPHSSCVEEQAALTECTTARPCRKYCVTAVQEECAEDESACVDQCLDDRKVLDSSCGHDYDRLLLCWSEQLSCVGGRPSIAGCEEDAAEVADCIETHGEYCDGFCWAAELLGCGSAECIGDCKLKLGHDRCGSDYRSVLFCVVAYDALNMECRDGVPQPDGNCANEEQQYQQCLLDYGAR